MNQIRQRPRLRATGCDRGRWAGGNGSPPPDEIVAGHGSPPRDEIVAGNGSLLFTAHSCCFLPLRLRGDLAAGCPLLSSVTAAAAAAVAARVALAALAAAGSGSAAAVPLDARPRGDLATTCHSSATGAHTTAVRVSSATAVAGAAAEERAAGLRATEAWAASERK